MKTIDNILAAHPKASEKFRKFSEERIRGFAAVGPEGKLMLLWGVFLAFFDSEGVRGITAYYNDTYEEYLTDVEPGVACDLFASLEAAQLAAIEAGLEILEAKI